MKKLLLFFLSFFIFSIGGNAQTVGDYRTSGSSASFSSVTNWQTWNGTTWVTPTSLPTTSSTLITVQSGHTVDVINNVTLTANLVISGTVSINVSNGKIFTVGTSSSWKNITVNSGGTLDMKLSKGNGTLVVQGNYNNNGATDFWKSNVVITGDLISPSTSDLQNQGNVIVAGNISGDFDLTGGTGSSQIYAVNPNATVDITPASIDNNVTPGTQPSSEDSSLIDLVNTIIYGNSCSFAIAGPTSNIVVCSGGSVSITASVASGVPSYQWECNSGSGWNQVSNGDYYSGATSSTLNINNVVLAMSGYKYRLSATVGGCTEKGNYVTMTIVTPLSINVQTVVPAALCSGSSLNPTAPTVSGSPVTSQGWQLETAVGSNVFANINVPYTVASADNGKKIRYYATNACGTIYSNEVAIEINEITGITGLTNVTQCLDSNHAYTVSVSNSNGATYQWKKSVSSETWTDVSNGDAYLGANTATLSIIGGTPDESADYKVEVTFASGCIMSSSTRKLTFLSQMPNPEFNAIQPVCGSSNGAITVTVQNANNEYSFDGGQTFGSSNVKTGAGNYVIVVRNSLGCVSSPITYNLEMSTSTWNGSSWLPSAPTSGNAIVFEGDYSSTDDLSGCSCLVKSGNVVINSGHTLTLQNEIAVVGGTFTLENNASLIQVNDIANSGSITVKRDSTPMAMYDYTYWSSPTSGSQTLKNFAPKSNPKFMLNYDNKWIYMRATSVFSKGIGYSILAPEPYAYKEPMISSHQFVGVPNNGDVNVPVTYLSSASSKLVGNPYPSAIDADKFIKENAGTITGTLYFWTHNHTKTNAGYSSDYAAYNSTGGTAVSSGHANKTAPTKWIASGQGFVVSVKASGNVVFNNSMRIKDSVYSNTNFYRNGSIVNSEKVLEKHRIWLNLVNDDNAFSQALVGYVESATNGDDFGFDGLNFGDNEIQLYSLIDTNPYLIQARALPFSNEDEVLLGFKTAKSGNFKISIDNMDGLFNEVEEVIVEDKLLGISQNIKGKPYSFSSDPGEFNNRFVLRYGSTAKDLDELQVDSNEVKIFSINHKIEIQSDLDSIKQVYVYDMLGRQVFENKKVNSNTVLINNLDEQQVLVVKAILNNGQTVTKKIIN